MTDPIPEPEPEPEKTPPPPDPLTEIKTAFLELDARLKRVEAHLRSLHVEL